MSDPIRQKIVEANPELMELTFGCEVKNQNDRLIYLYTHAPKWCGTEPCDDYVLVTYFPAADTLLYINDPDFERESDRKDKHVEILGHPIMLHHVLRAINKSNLHPSGSGAHISQHYVSDDGAFMEYGYGTKVLSRWNLSLGYDDQPQPTKDFIGSVLGVKK
jgi:hypothetical protein